TRFSRDWSSDVCSSDLKTGYAPVMREGEVVAVIGVEASAEFFVLLRNFASVMTFLGLVGLLLMMLVSAVVSRRITKPVRALVASDRKSVVQGKSYGGGG